MGGRSGQVAAQHTPIVHRGAQRFAVSLPQKKLIARAEQAGGAIHVERSEVRTARSLLSFGELRDDGALSTDGAGNPDGERWTFTLKKGVTAGGPCAATPPPPNKNGVAPNLDLEPIRARRAAATTLRAAKRSCEDVPVLIAEIERIRKLARDVLRVDVDECQAMIDVLRAIAGLPVV